MVAVVAVNVIAHGYHVFDDGLEVVHVTVGIEHGGIVGVVQVVCAGIGAEGTVHLELIDTVLQAGQRLVHIHRGAVALSSTDGACLRIADFGTDLSLPSVESVLEIGVGKQLGDVGAGSGLVGECCVQHGIDLGCLGLDLFGVQQTLLQDVGGRTVAIFLAGLIEFL